MPSSRSQSVQHNMPSPTTSMRTVMTAPLRGPPRRSQFLQADSSPLDHSVDPFLSHSMLAPPNPYSQSSYDPIARQLQEQPWSAHNPRSSVSSGSRSPLLRSPGQFIFPHGSVSEVDVSDSGYISQPPPSLLSNEPNCYNQDLSPTITDQVNNMNVASTSRSATEMRRISSDSRSQISSRSARSGRSGKHLQCQECGEVSKCNSDHKYVF